MSSIVSLEALVLSKVKIKRGLETIYELSDDSNRKDVEGTLPMLESIEKTLSHIEDICEDPVLSMKSLLLLIL